MKDYNKDSKPAVLEDTKQKLEEEGLILDRELIKEIVDEGQFKYVKKTIREGFFQSILITGLGKFKARLHLIQIRNGKQRQTGTDAQAKGEGGSRDASDTASEGRGEE